MKHLIQSKPFFLKSVDEDGLFMGYASVFDCIDQQNDQVLPGAFLKSLECWREKQALPKMLWQHDHRVPIGQWLDMQEDATGLLVKGKIGFDLPRGRDAYALLKHNKVNGLSIGFTLGKARYSHLGHKLLEEINLEEVSLVMEAANPKAKVEWVKHMVPLDMVDVEARLAGVVEGIVRVADGSVF